MASKGKVTLGEVVMALQLLGGEADWRDIFRQLNENRSGNYSHYRHYDSYEKTAFQVIQHHCRGYGKFRGPVRFEKVAKDRFRLCAVFA